MVSTLTIAGSDPSGGAGIQADLKTFAAHGVYGMSVITAITAQNTLGVTGVETVSPEMIAAQLDAVFTDIVPDAVKIGMVASREIAEVIADRLKYYKPANIVLDPVMVATSGDTLCEDNPQTMLLETLIPLATVITPNIPEAGTLAGFEVATKKDMMRAARDLAGFYRGTIFIKGGHLSDTADDLLYHEGFGFWMPQQRIDNPNTHGTGCTLSSAIAANLAKGMDCVAAIRKAQQYVHGAIADGLNLGQGNGPLNHLYQFNF